MRNALKILIGFALLLATGWMGCGPVDDTLQPLQILEGAKTKIQQSAARHWLVKTKYKGFDDPDTLNFQGALLFKRQSGSQEGLPNIHLRTMQGGVLVLNDSLLWIAEQKGDPLQMVKRSLYGASHVDMLNFGKLIPDVLVDQPYMRWRIKDFDLFRRKDSLVNGTPCWVLEFVLKAALEEDIKRRLAIGIADSLPRLIETTIHLLGQTQFEYQLINPDKATEISQASFGEAALPGDREVVVFQTEEEKRLLSSGTQAPDFERTTLNDHPFQLTDHLGKVVLLDFWFMRCQPCIEAFPYLEKLHQTYAEKGLEVVGVNPIDPMSASLSAFVEKKQLSYTVIPVAAGVHQMYKVEGYPTLYLIDREGKIAGAWLGHGEARPFFEELEQSIQDCLNKPSSKST